MTSHEDRVTASAGHNDHDGDPDATVDQGTGGAGVSQSPRLVASWLIVGVPLAYGIYQTVSKTLPLFGG
ncbi:MAG: MFS transporter small subunit [Geodermatophilaceae bacterium]